MEQKRSPTRCGLAPRRTAATRHAGTESRIRSPSESLNDLDDTSANLRGEVVQQLFLLVHQIRRNTRAQPLSLARGIDHSRPSIRGIRSLFYVPLSQERIHHAAGRAFVQKQAFRQRTQAHRTVVDQRLQGVALRHGNVVAADAIAISELIHAHEVGDSLLQRHCVTIERGLLRFGDLR
jgi:hypothetical protein